MVAARRASTAHISARTLQACTASESSVKRYLDAYQRLRAGGDILCFYFGLFFSRSSAEVSFSAIISLFLSHSICTFSCFSFLYKSEK